MLQDSTLRIVLFWRRVGMMTTYFMFLLWDSPQLSSAPPPEHTLETSTSSVDPARPVWRTARCWRRWRPTTRTPCSCSCLMCGWTTWVCLIDWGLCSLDTTPCLPQCSWCVATSLVVLENRTTPGSWGNTWDCWGNSSLSIKRSPRSQHSCSCLDQVILALQTFFPDLLFQPTSPRTWSN